MNVTLPVAVSVSVSVNPTGTICAGTLVEFNALPVNGGPNPVYQWFVNSSPAGGNSPTYTYFPSNGDQVHVVITTSLTCTSGSPATSPDIILSVEDPLTAGVTIEADTNNICEGTIVTFTASPVNGGTPTYQWYLNGIPSGQNLPTFSYIPLNGDSVYVAMTTSVTCVVTPTVISNLLGMTVNPLLPASVAITADQNPVCEGSTVTFTAVGVNGGNAMFRWFRNGTPEGDNTPHYSTVPQDGDRIRVEMISDLPCAVPDSVTSNEVVMTVDPRLPVGVDLLVSATEVCSGTPVTFTAVPVNGGVPIYEWFRNGTSIGNNQPVLVMVPANGDTYSVKMTSSLSCVTSPAAWSDTVSVTVNSPVPASLTITSDPATVCQGSPVTFTAHPVNGGEPDIRWYRNGEQAGEGMQFTMVPASGDRIHAEMTSTLECADPLVSLSNTVEPQVTLLPGQAGSISGPDTICAGESGVVCSVQPIPGASTYTWSLPAGVEALAGEHQVEITLAFSRDFTGGEIRVQGNNDCGTGVLSPAHRIIAIPLPPVPVISVIQNTIVGNQLGITQWYYEGSLLQDSTGNTLSPVDPGWYWCETIVNGCPSDTSNHVYFYGVFPGGDNSAKGFWVYPVPNDGKFTIAISLPAPETFDIDMYNSMGIRVFDISGLTVDKKFKRIVDLRPRLKKGLYFVIFRGKDYQVWKKVLVNGNSK